MCLRRSAAGYLACAALAASSANAAHQQSASIQIGGQTRDYILAAPDRAATGKRPLILLLHGHIGTAANALGAGFAPSPLSAWLEIVDREQVLVAALQGLRGTDNRTGWHDCRSDDTQNTHADDVGFAARVVHELIASGAADARRIYVMGMSNGAMMSYRLALEMRPTPAAIAAVAGTMAARSDCAAARKPVSVLLIHGTADPLVPFGGGEVGFASSRAGGGSGSVISVAATRDYWLKADGLGSTAQVLFAFEHHGSDTTSASKVTYGADSGPQVEVVTVQGGGHVEPSLRYHYGPVYSHIVGPQSRDLESAEEAWTFFRDKSAPTAAETPE